MTSPYIWLRKKDINAVKLGIKHTKMALKFDVIQFKNYWSDRRYYKKDFLRGLVSSIRAYKLIIASLYKEIPVPLHIEKEMQILHSTVNGSFPISYTTIMCPTCGELYYDEDGEPNHCLNCGQKLWWNDPIDDALVRYENGSFDGVHRRLKQER